MLDSNTLWVPSENDSEQALRWYAVQTRSRFEKAVRTELERAGIEHYFASVEEVHQWKDRRKVVELPIFPGYVFVRIEDLHPARLQVLRTNGVVRILGNASAIEPIPDEEIGSIRRLLSSGRSCFAHPFLTEGAWVRVRRGALAGLEGRLLRIKNDTRLVLSVDLLAKSVATEIDVRDVEPAAEPRRNRSQEPGGR